MQPVRVSHWTHSTNNGSPRQNSPLRQVQQRSDTRTPYMSATPQHTNARSYCRSRTDTITSNRKLQPVASSQPPCQAQPSAFAPGIPALHGTNPTRSMHAKARSFHLVLVRHSLHPRPPAQLKRPASLFYARRATNTPSCIPTALTCTQRPTPHACTVARRTHQHRPPHACSSHTPSAPPTHTSPCPSPSTTARPASALPACTAASCAHSLAAPT